MKVEVIQTTSLGNRGYLIHDGEAAIAVDVQRDYDRWENAASKAKVSITHILETHMHNDYVTGGYELSQKLPSSVYIVPADSHISFSATEAHDGEVFKAGSMTITAIHTPGHTEHHTSYHVTDGGQGVVLTGGGVLYGTVGRTDLVDQQKTMQLTEAQYDSAHRLASLLPAETRVLPTHGFGSFCSSSEGTKADESDLETEMKVNLVYTSQKPAFIEAIIKGLGPYPKYYAQMGPLNQAGPGGVAQLHIHEYSAEAIARSLKKDKSWVIDTRNRKAFAAGHPEQSMGIELGDSFATYTGWIIPWDEELLLVGDSDQDLHQAHAELARIGMDQFVDGATQATQSYLSATTPSSYPVKQFTDLAQDAAEKIILDVRQVSEWEDGHIHNARNIPLHELMTQGADFPSDIPIWVHCASGYRASIAASILDRLGKKPVLVDDEFSSAVKLKLT